MSEKTLVLDANILIRAVLGQRVLELIFAYEPVVKFYAPDVAYADAREHLPALLTKRGANPEQALEVLARLEPIVLPLEAEVYETAKDEALRRIGPRDPDDWPVLACAMMLGCPVWTEDADFFGTGVATWTTDRIMLYLTEQRDA